MSKRSNQKLSLADLEELYAEYNHPRWRKTDPIMFAYRYQDPHDIEVAALVAALFAYGNVKAMCQSIEKILKYLGTHPSQCLRDLATKSHLTLPQDFYYRFFSTEDIAGLLLRMARVIASTGSLGAAMRSDWMKSNDNVCKAISLFRNRFVPTTGLTPGMKFMFPDPERGAAKRLHMFLRWMVRKDEIDLGLWDFIPRSMLLVPLDTHVFKAARTLKLTRRKSPSLNAALEVSQAFRKISPEDPLRYDFALCHNGMQKGM